MKKSGQAECKTAFYFSKTTGHRNSPKTNKSAGTKSTYKKKPHNSKTDCAAFFAD